MSANMRIRLFSHAVFTETTAIHVLLPTFLHFAACAHFEHQGRTYTYGHRGRRAFLMLLIQPISGGCARCRGEMSPKALIPPASQDVKLKRQTGVYACRPISASSKDESACVLSLHQAHITRMRLCLCTKTYLNLAHAYLPLGQGRQLHLRLSGILQLRVMP
jgi:hypothetical protein